MEDIDIPLKRMQQILSKKNSYSLDINKRNKFNQLTQDDKVARISDSETYALMTSLNDYDKDGNTESTVLQEFLGFRGDSAGVRRNKAYQSIYNEGYLQLKDIEEETNSLQHVKNLEDRTTLNNVDAYFTAAGLMTDLITPSYHFSRTVLHGEVDAKQRQYSKKQAPK